jgi:hypothetical protein
LVAGLPKRHVHRDKVPKPNRCRVVLDVEKARVCEERREPKCPSTIIHELEMVEHGLCLQRRNRILEPKNVHILEQHVVASQQCDVHTELLHVHLLPEIRIAVRNRRGLGVPVASGAVSGICPPLHDENRTMWVRANE